MVPVGEVRVYPSVLLLVALAGASGPVLADLRFVEGEARDLASGQLLYREQHWIRRDGAAPVERLVLYRCPSGAAFARKRVDYRRSSTAPEFGLEDARSNYREGLRRSGTAASVYSGAKTTALPAPTATLVADAGFDEFLRARWDVLVAGRPQPLEFVVPAFGRALGFEVRSAGRTRIGDAPVERFRLRLDGLLGAVAPSLDVAYDARDRSLRRFSGVTNVRDDRGRQVKARIDFADPARAAPAAAWQAGLAQPLARCALGS